MSYNDKAIKIRTGEELPIEVLNVFLKENINDFGQINEITQYPGGYSNLTYLLSTTNKKYVLRKPPKGAENIKGGHNMLREFNILKNIYETGFRKIPQPIIFCDNHDIIGSDFYLMQKVEGTIIRTSQFEQVKAALVPNKIKVLSTNLCETLAELHKIDIEKTGLINIGKPEGYIKRQVTGWYERYKAAETDDIPEMNIVYHWLSSNMPEEIKPTLIHNDFKYDNVVINLSSEEILAILDWEMATVGDPRMDIGTCLSYWCEAQDSDFEKTFNLTWLEGNLTKKEFIAYYKTINNIDLSQILYFYVFGLFKNSVVIQQIFARYKKGLTNDERFANLGYGVKKLIRKAKLSIEADDML
jgi:aminoglycoside phosphotransferase (APT) family kinase protein